MWIALARRAQAYAAMARSHHARPTVPAPSRRDVSRALVIVASAGRPASSCSLIASQNRRLTEPSPHRTKDITAQRAAEKPMPTPTAINI